MKHNIPVDNVGPMGEEMAAAVQKCVHCGFCLPTCPTYQTLGQEMDSPRGRIVLMKEVLEGNLTPDQASPFLDRCLGCLACETACPSGVKYGELISPYRSQYADTGQRSVTDRLKRWMVSQTLPYPGRFRAALRLSKFGQAARWMVPRNMHAMLDLAPTKLPKSNRLPPISSPQGTRRARVALLVGCAQQVIAPEINMATIDVLVKNGVEVVIPEQQGCCGALSWHVGNLKQARKLARSNMRTFPQDVDAIVINAAGCGSAIHEYPVVFKGTAEHEMAVAFAAQAKDVSLFLDELGLVETPTFSKPIRVAYHDACHLAHAQGIRMAPRNLLRQCENLEMVEIREGGTCCGSAGTYNIDQPEIADELGQRKAQHIADTSSDIVAAGNIGCIVQIAKQASRHELFPRVLHTMQVLQLGYSRQN